MQPRRTAAKKPCCAEQVVADWYDNGRVDYLYPLHCYRDAIKSLPPDVKDYSSAKEEIYARSRTPRTAPGEGADVAPETGSNPDDRARKPTPTPADIAADMASNTAGPSSVPIPLIVLGRAFHPSACRRFGRLSRAPPVKLTAPERRRSARAV